MRELTLTPKAHRFFEIVLELEGHEFKPTNCDRCKRLWELSNLDYYVAAKDAIAVSRLRGEG